MEMVEEGIKDNGEGAMGREGSYGEKRGMARVLKSEKKETDKG